MEFVLNKDGEKGRVSGGVCVCVWGRTQCPPPPVRGESLRETQLEAVISQDGCSGVRAGSQAQVEMDVAL